MAAAKYYNAVVIGASGGIGKALIDSLADRGIAHIHALSRSAALNLPEGVQSGHIDIGDEHSIAAAADSVAEHGPVDLVIVASGLLHNKNLQPEKSYRALSGEVLAEYFAVNATGPALVAKHFLPLLSRERRAVFACLSARVGSIADNRLGGWYGYRASKAALNMLIRTLAVELVRTRPQGICAGLHPGTVDSTLSKPFQRSAPSLVSPATAAGNLLHVIDGLSVDDSGGVYAWDGKPIPF
ncbi:SDR family NAD(P)-dependent oxidoreductase [Inquilinus sp. CAU 1745]|uniref:SDR family NAD(P)-dependent oxidoreductase n=1 Tax=Inquilinus sp. CAU 1745 TaxID=3140369 RepID=UPI00325B2C13